MTANELTTDNANQNPDDRRALPRNLLALASLALAAILLPACQTPYDTSDAIKGINEELNYALADHLESLNVDPEEARRSGVKLACPDLAYEGKAISCALTGRHIEKTQLKMRVDSKGELDFASDTDLKTAVVGTLNEEMGAGMRPIIEMAGAGPAVTGRAGVSVECPGKIADPISACILSGSLSGRSVPVRMKLTGLALDYANNPESKKLERMLAAEAIAAQRVTKRAQ